MLDATVTRQATTPADPIPFVPVGQAGTNNGRANGKLDCAATLEADHRRRAEVENTIRDLKYGVGLNHLPSGPFGANAAWYRLSLLAYNVLTVLKRHALPERLRDARPKRLRFEVFSLPAVLTEHARQLTAQVAAAPLTVEELILARGRLRDLRRQITDGSGPHHA